MCPNLLFMCLHLSCVTRGDNDLDPIVLGARHDSRRLWIVVEDDWMSMGQSQAFPTFNTPQES